MVVVSADGGRKVFGLCEVVDVQIWFWDVRWVVDLVVVLWIFFVVGMATDGRGGCE